HDAEGHEHREAAEHEPGRRLDHAQPLDILQDRYPPGRPTLVRRGVMRSGPSRAGVGFGHLGAISSGTETCGRITTSPGWIKFGSGMYPALAWRMTCHIAGSPYTRWAIPDRLSPVRTW